MWNKLTRIGVAVLAIALVFECALRVVYVDHYGGDGPNGYNSWAKKHYRRNALGHRDHEFTVEKPADTYRILNVGDSFTVGEGVDSLDDVYSEVLEKKLNSSTHAGSRRRFEVLNVAKRYWEIEDYLTEIRVEGLSYDPDLIVLGLYINDIEDRRQPRPIKRTLPQHLVSFSWRVERFASQSYLYWYTVTPYASWRHKEFWFEYVGSYVDPESDHYQRFERLYAEIIALSRKHDIPLVVAVFPYLVDLDDSHPFIPTYERLTSFAISNGASAVNFFPVLRQHELSRLRAGATRWLPSEEAHRIIADELYRHIEELGFPDQFQTQ